MIGHNEAVKTEGGKRAGSRRGATRTRHPRTRTAFAFLLTAFAVTAAILAWGYLVYTAIQHGQSWRAGDRDAWRIVAAAGIGAAGCLLIALMLIARCFRLMRASHPADF